MIKKCFNPMYNYNSNRTMATNSIFDVASVLIENKIKDKKCDHKHSNTKSEKRLKKWPILIEKNQKSRSQYIQIS